MRTSSLLMLGETASLPKRQTNSAVGVDVFRRRAYQSSAVLDGFLYIDGGEFSYASGGVLTRQYSNTLLAIDLTKEFTNATVNIHSSSKGGAPNLISGGIWVDTDNHLLYTGFAGRRSTYGNGDAQPNGLWSFKPDGTGSGTWTNLNGSADAAFMSEDRPFSPNVASGGGFGYMLGGFATNDSEANPRGSALNWNISSFTTYDFQTKKLTNTTITSTSVGSVDQMGGLVYSPNFGEKGILVQIGGDQVGKVKAGSDSLLPLDTVQIFDVARGSWYDQKVSGNVPQARKEFCVAGAASNNKTFDIMLYAGWNGQLGNAAIPFDEAFVLTLPGFHWIKAPYPASQPRHGLSCNSIGGGQILAVGGVDTTINGPDNLYSDVFNSKDPDLQGLAVFDMSTMTFKNKFAPKQTVYTISSDLENFYSNNPRLPTFDNSTLGSVFAIQTFSTTNSTSPPNTSKPTSKTNTGAIIGGVVGGIVGAILLSAIAYFFISRRRKNQHPVSESAKYEHPPSYKYGSSPSGTAAVNGGFYHREETPGGLAELPAQTGKYETLAAGDMSEMERSKYGVVHHAAGTQVELEGSSGDGRAVELP